MTAWMRGPCSCQKSLAPGTQEAKGLWPSQLSNLYLCIRGILSGYLLQGKHSNRACMCPLQIRAPYFIIFFFPYFIYLFIFYFWLCWVFGSCEGFLQLRQAGATLHCSAGTALHCGARAFLYRGPSRCGAQAPDAQAQQLWLTGPAAPQEPLILKYLI